MIELEYVTDENVYQIHVEVDHFKPECNAYLSARPEHCYPAQCAEVEYRITWLKWETEQTVNVITGYVVSIPTDINRSQLDAMVINKITNSGGY